MIRFFTILALCLGYPSMVISQSNAWLHIYSNKKDYHGYQTNDIKGLTHDLNTEELTVTTFNGSYSIPLEEIAQCEVGTNVPAIYIDLSDFPEYTDIKDKNTYLHATIRIDGNGHFPDLEATNVNIKGRGNSTWWYNKKPYRLKFDKKTGLLDFKKAKNYVLIANYIDGTLMQNSLALKTAQLLGMPYTNHVQPVRVFINGILKGSYILTEKVGINAASVDIDENSGLLFELDANYDEDYKFYSKTFNLPVMVKDPDLSDICLNYGLTPEELLNLWREDFETFETKIKDQTLTEDYIDWDSFVNYMIVFNIFGNQEINHPKSLYIYKEKLDSPYHFGPVWDFDWACGYSPGRKTRFSAKTTLLSSKLIGGGFLVGLMENPIFKDLYAQRWTWFKDEIWPVLLQYMDEYAQQIRPSAIENGVIWPDDPSNTIGSYDFDNNVASLRLWLSTRIDYITSHRNFGLY